MQNGITIEKIDIQILKPHFQNPREITPEQKKHLTKSLKRFGFVDPVIINQDNTIIGGHQRVSVAEEIGIKEVPAVRLNLSENDAKLLMIGLNKLGGSWEPEKLKTLLDEFTSFGEDLEVAGFGPEEMEGFGEITDGEWQEAFDNIPQGERANIQIMRFTVSNSQEKIISEALRKAKSEGPFIESDNENSNGNALARIADRFNGQG